MGEPAAGRRDFVRGWHAKWVAADSIHCEKSTTRKWSRKAL